MNSNLWQGLQNSNLRIERSVLSKNDFITEIINQFMSWSETLSDVWQTVFGRLPNRFSIRVQGINFLKKQLLWKKQKLINLPGRLAIFFGHLATKFGQVVETAFWLPIRSLCGTKN